MPASRKLGRTDAVAMLQGVKRVSVAKGKNVQTFDPKVDAQDAIVDAMLGPTGNLRAPTIRRGDKLYIGFPKDGFGAL